MRAVIVTVVVLVAFLPACFLSHELAGDSNDTAPGIDNGDDQPTMINKAGAGGVNGSSAKSVPEYAQGAGGRESAPFDTGMEKPIDTGTEEPTISNKCCRLAGRELGTCIPDVALPPDYQGVLPQDSCLDPRDVCVPDNLIPDPDVTAKGCLARYTIPDTVPPLEIQLEGRCLPECIIDIEVNETITREDCGPGEKCLACLILEGFIPGACG